MTTFSRNIATTAAVALLLAATSIGLVACDSQQSSVVAPTEEPEIFGLTSESPETGEGTEGVLGLAPAEYRFCDNTSSAYTVEGTQDNGQGEGGTRSSAAAAAVQDAVKENLKSQFTCDKCPDSDDRCEKFIGRYYTGGAAMEDPVRDCNWDPAKRQYVCNGPVIFGGGGPTPHGYAGCKKCPEEDQSGN